MRVEALRAVKMSMLVFWVVTPCGLVGRYHISEKHTVSIFRVFGLEDGNSMFLQNVDICLQVHMALQPRKPTLADILMSAR
jgi:hypothetical protein